MTKRTHRGLAFFLIVSCVAFSSTAKASFLYGNGPADGTFGAVDIGDDDNGQTVADSFVLSTQALVTGIDFAVWTADLIGVSSVDWAITTSPFGTVLDSGTANPTSTLNQSLTDLNAGFNVFMESFDIDGVNLAANTTYWLELSGAALPDADPADTIVYWDVNNGPSEAFVTPPLDPTEPSGSLADFYGGGDSGSETFRLLGTETPEPGTVTMLLSGLLLLSASAFYKTRRRGIQLLPQTARLEPRD